jgi:predicted Zn-dependent peptidase
VPWFGTLALFPAPVAAQADFPTTPPKPGSAPSIELPDPVERRLANGMTVMYVRQPELPIVHATLVTRGGQADAPATAPELASFVAEMLDEGAGGRGALELASALETLGASLSVGAGWDAVNVDLEVLKPRFADALKLMADVVMRPDFPAEEIERLRERRLTELARAKDEARIIAGNAFAALVYGEDHPYGRLPSMETTRSIDRPALVEFHRTHYAPSATTLVLVGDVEPSALHAAVEQTFGTWQAGGALPPVASVDAPAVPQTTLVLIDKPGAAQSEIRIGHPGVARDDPDYFPLLVLNTILGGSFTSRLNMNLRETHGYAYGASSSFSMRKGPGPFTASSAVHTQKTDSAVIEFFNELRRMREQAVPEDELQRAKNYIALGMPRQFETVGSVAGQLASLTVYELDMNFYDTFIRNVMDVSAADVQRVAREHVRPDRAVIVVVGDRQAIEPGLSAIGIAPVLVRDAGEFVR